ncbi:hydantoinase/oxoprolinase family protein [Hyperthermus butylicus]|uniref:Hydantoin utilization protein A n=1 Tax=Hyperthermus butylicus (strain DSM 5456 / JCM 9403 / PLM1-5) TaxID=415426 RepID=A2BN77_HYPBU|nr:hydantoinase/oxoprolinase family protein [Hyperthermus butylicus]ABM81438.1 Hydantoin utilization protein A [Hyperthermus butylicus DSM 5456]
MLRVGIDVGGTFTDIVVFDEESGRLVAGKVLTVPREPWRGVLGAFDALGVRVSDVGVFVHATTLGTNMFLGQVGIEPPVAVLITNAGFRDVIEIGRQNRAELYNLFFEKPQPLVPRSRRFGVRGRVSARGEELEPLDVGAVRRIAREWCGRAKVFIISFLHCYANDAHERLAARVVREECPGAEVVTGCEVDPEPGEFERTSTAVVNGLLRPILSRYLSKLAREMEQRGFRGRFLVMQSSGGVASLEYAVRFPAAFIESGPAAGVVATAYFAEAMGIRYALSFDMGGTTAKAAAIVNGEPIVADMYEVGGKVHMGRVLRGSGYPVRYPFIDIAEVSAGGGTIAWVDAGGALRVGPISAGADPGPACYGRGGREPTVTDANLVLGRLPEVLAGGRVRLHRNLAKEALEKLAKAVGMDTVEAALAVIRIADTVMARALRLVSIEKGYDPRMFTLFAFGGAGPLHAVSLARELGVPRVVVPPYTGVFSALGLLLTDYRHDLRRPVVRRADELEEEQLNKVFDELADEAKRILASEGVPEERVRLTRLLEARYEGQAYSLTIPYHGSLSEAVNEFHKLHAARYGYSMPEHPVVIVSARLVAIGVTPKPRLPRSKPLRHTPEPVGYREVYFKDDGWTRTPIYRRDRLKPGAVLKGPAVIESDDSTILIPPDSVGTVDEHHSIVISVGGGSVEA